MRQVFTFMRESLADQLANHPICIQLGNSAEKTLAAIAHSLGQSGVLTGNITVADVAARDAFSHRVVKHKQPIEAISTPSNTSKN